MLAINMSYVLHERSSSRTVRHACGDARRFYLRHSMLLTRFERLSDEELLAATMITPGIRGGLTDGVRPGMILTASLGLSELLPRALSLSFPAVAGETMSRHHILDDLEPGTSPVYIPLFRGRAGLQSVTLADRDRPVAVMALVVRPGATSLLLSGSIVPAEQLAGYDELVEVPAVRRGFESIVRDYVDQWCPPRALWDRPAEEQLAELGALTPGSD
ncbi:MAG: hypothetical protein ACOC9Y_09180 [Chloroflexota bacterium]